MEDEEAANEIKTNNISNKILRLPSKEQHLLQTLSSSPIVTLQFSYIVTLRVIPQCMVITTLSRLTCGCFNAKNPCLL